MSVFNILKKYPELLDLVNLDEHEKNQDLQRIFKRDIEDNSSFAFRSRFIYPIKADGEADMGRLFKHLTCEEITVEDENGKKYPKRVLEMNRSERLHWINHWKIAAEKTTVAEWNVPLKKGGDNLKQIYIYFSDLRRDFPRKFIFSHGSFI